MDFVIAAVMITTAGCGAASMGSSGAGNAGAAGGAAGTGPGATDAAGGGGDAGGATDGPGGGADAAITTGARAFCAGSLAPTPYLGVGDTCGAGSNYPLCVLADKTCGTGLCLWDQADPKKDRSYCTITCQMGVAGACPSGFECKPDMCDKKPICVRTQVPPMTIPGVEIVPNVFTATSIKTPIGTLNDKTYWLGWQGTAYEQAANGTVTELAGSLPGGLRGTHAVPTGDGFLLWIDNGDTLIGRVANGMFSTTKWSEAAGLFRTAAGTIYVLEANQYDSTFVPVANDVTRSANLTSYLHPAATLRPYRIAPLRDFGFVGMCVKGTAADGVACASADGTTIADLGAVDVDFEIARQSFRPDRIWLPVPGSPEVISELGLWNGTAWVKESLQPGYEQLIGQLTFTPTIEAIVPLSRTDDRLIVIIGDTFTTNFAYAPAGCFTPLFAVGTTYSVPTGRAAESMWQPSPDAILWIGNGIDQVTLRSSAFAAAPYR